MITAFVFIDAAPKHVASLGRAIADIDGVREVYSVAGNEDLVAVIWVRDHEEVATVVTERIGVMEGVVGTRTLIAFREYSKADRELA